MWIMMYINYFLMAASFFGLSIWLYIKYFNIIFLDMNHIQFSLIASIFYMLSQTIIMFYFIATGKNIKKFIIDNNLDIKSYDNILKMKMKLFSHIMLNMVLVGVVFIIGGAIYSSIITDWQFNLLFIFTILHYGYLILIQHDSFKENTELVIKLYRKVNL